MSEQQCHFCGASVTVEEVVPRESECESCHRDLRCCVNCRHYDTRYNNSCRETMADPVEFKDRRNFCEYFSFSFEPFEPPRSEARASEARAKLDALFGKTPGAPDRAAEARKKLDALFRKPESGKPQDPGTSGG